MDFDARRCKHVARLPPIGERLKILGGQYSYTGHRIQLTIAITDSATTVKTELQNNAASEASRKFFWLVPPIVTFWGTLVANEVKKNFN